MREQRQKWATNSSIEAFIANVAQYAVRYQRAKGYAPVDLLPAGEDARTRRHGGGAIRDAVRFREVFVKCDRAEPGRDVSYSPTKLAPTREELASFETPQHDLDPLLMFGKQLV